MWVVAKVKIKNLHTFKKDLVEKTDNNIKFYHPKIEYDRYEGNNIKKLLELESPQSIDSFLGYDHLKEYIYECDDFDQFLDITTTRQKRTQLQDSMNKMM